MADIRCPNCGKNNPDFLDVCQFCQTPLTSDSMVHIGENPTKKNTGELEPILPDWLRDVRQQSRDSAEDGELPSSATKPRIQKNEAPDLLAGLASQSDDDDDEIPDWLASINPVAKPKPSESSPPEPSIDFFAQFNKTEAAPEKPSQVSEPPKEETPTWMGEPSQPEIPAEKDELSAWFSNAAEAPGEPFAFQPEATQNASDWMSTPGSSEPASQPARPQEDLSWLHDLEASSKQAETPSEPNQDASWNVDMPATSPSTQEDLSWLNNLGGTAQPARPQEDLSWLNDLGGAKGTTQPSQAEDLSWLDSLGGISEPAGPASQQPSQQEDLGWLNALGGISEPAQPSAQQPPKKEDLSWLDTLGGTPEPAQPASVQPSQTEDLSWLNELGGPSAAAPTPASAPQEDLSWLNNLGGSSEAAQPTVTPSSSDDLSWLDTLGGTAEPSQPASAEPATSSGDLDWLGKLSQASEPSQPEPAQSTSQDDLDWLKNFAASTSAETPQPPATDSQDLSWLDTLGGTAEPSQPAPAEPAASSGDLDWLAGLGGLSATSTFESAKPFGTTDELSPPKDFDENAPPHVLPFAPRRTAPLDGETFNDNMPDWLKSATEETPNLPLGANALEQFRETPRKPLGETLPPTPEPASVGSDVFSTPSESQSISNQEIDSLFSMDMPDWLSKPEPDTAGVTPQQAEIPARDESLSPVELPSWVQAMRPVESVISETGPSIESQPTEKEGPLAGLRGVIPSAPIGSSRRPKAISLKLLATDEQQAGASLFEQILAGESAPRVVTSLSTVTSQRTLRIAISVVFWVVLGAILFLRSQWMPISAVLPPDVSGASNAIAAIPGDASVLVVVDYDPSLAGEMEAVGAPVLNHLVLTRQPRLVFLSTSANSVGLIERLVSNAHIPAPYFNLGYLPGGSAGIAGFLVQPNRVISSAAAQSFAEYSAVIVLTDHAESGRAWVEQLDVAKQTDPSLANQPLILVTSAQAGPLLQPYVSSKQAAGMVNGLADAARFEYANNIPAENRIARNYWDAFGVGILLAIVLIIIGSAWSLVTGIRARRANGEQG